MTSQRLQWHPRLHEAWSQERLHFWRLAFAPTYDRARIKSLLETAMDAHGVSSFAMYELFGGGYDVLLRVWLHSGHNAFDEVLRDALREYAVVMQTFTVSTIVMHWPWTDADGVMRSVPEGRVAQRLSDDEIEQVMSGSITDAQRDTYVNENLIAGTPSVAEPITPDADRGITFVVVISANQYPMTHYAVDRLVGSLRQVLVNADGVDEKSLYGGLGFGQYLLMGRVKDYFDITTQITEPINTAVDPATFGARTTTFLVSTPGLLGFRDDIRRAEIEPGALTLDDYLSRDESQTLEVKASALVDIDRWLFTDGKRDESNVVINGGFLRAVAGMLNADGGTLVLGALEAKRYSGHEQLSDAPRLGEYICLGLGLDVGDRDWDAYERKLRDLLKARLRPDPNPWIAFSRAMLGDRLLCVVAVRVPGRRSTPGGVWFYHYPDKNTAPKFWARQGNRTVELAGPELDAYRFETLGS